MGRTIWAAAGLVAGVGLGGGAAAADQPWSLHDALSAPSDLTLSGSVRARYEALSGQARPGFAASEDIVVLRSALFAEYHPGPIRLGVEIYDSRAYGIDAGSVVSTNEVDALEPVQAYVAADFKGAVGAGTSATLQAGRMTLNLGSRRLVAADDYRNTTNSYTGVRADVVGARGFSATAVWVEPQARLPADLASLRANRVALDKESPAAQLWGGVASQARLIGDLAGEVEYFGFSEADRPGAPTRDRHLNSYGARLIRAPKPGQWDVELQGIYQDGRVGASTAPAAARLPVSAGFVHLAAGWTFTTAWKPRVSLQYDWVSGDRGGTTYGRFDTLFGMRRADFAPSGIYNEVGRANIETPAIRVEATPSARWDWMASVRPMWLASRTDSFSTTGVRDATERSGRYAGTQVDGRVRVWLVPRSLRLELDGDWIAKGRFLHDAPNAPRTGDTVYGSASVAATF